MDICQLGAYTKGPSAARALQQVYCPNRGKQSSSLFSWLPQLSSNLKSGCEGHLLRVQIPKKSKFQTQKTSDISAVGSSNSFEALLTWARGHSVFFFSHGVCWCKKIAVVVMTEPVRISTHPTSRLRSKALDSQTTHDRRLWKSFLRCS